MPFHRVAVIGVLVFSCATFSSGAAGTAVPGAAIIGAPPAAVTPGSDATSTVALSTPASGYTVLNLGTLGGTSSIAGSINERRWTTGIANLGGDHAARAVLWRGGQPLSLGTLGGLNSGVLWPNHNNFGLIAGISETATVDPLNEDWSCQAFFPTTPNTKHVCSAFAWRNGQLAALPTLGGINGYGAGSNDEGQIVGWTETPLHDRTCTAVTKIPNSFYQVLQFVPVVWNGYDPQRRPTLLPTVHGDPDGAATAINDAGMAVGITGACDQAVGRFTAQHAVVWQNGIATDIGNFDGGVAWNTPSAINQFGAVVGFMNLPGAQGHFRPVAFVWTRHGGLQRIDPLAGDTNALATGINDLGQIVGQSYNATTGAARAFIWENGGSYDLNAFLPAGSPLYLIAANDIDDLGNIVGQATDAGASTSPAFLAIAPHHWDPAKATPMRTNVIIPRLSANVRRALFARLGLPVPDAR